MGEAVSATAKFKLKNKQKNKLVSLGSVTVKHTLSFVFV